MPMLPMQGALALSSPWRRSGGCAPAAAPPPAQAPVPSPARAQRQAKPPPPAHGAVIFLKRHSSIVQFLMPLLCAALLGVMCFLGVAVFNLVGADDSASSPAPLAMMQQPLVMSAPRFEAGGASEAVVQSLFSNLQRQMESQEQARRIADLGAEARLRRLEEKVTADLAAAAARVPTQAALPAAAVPAISVSASAAAGDVEGRGAVAALGVDWGAWTAGADIDFSATSWGLGRDPSVAGLLGRASRIVASAVPHLRTVVSPVSHPPTVVLAADGVAPSKCFTLGGNGTVAIKLLQPQRVTHVVLEHLPSWADLEPQAAPRFFSLSAWPATSTERYHSPLGSFEYALGGPRVQAFPLALEAGAVQAVKFDFGENWGASRTLVCRLRVMGPQA